jgi:hypothetical protein
MDPLAVSIFDLQSRYIVLLSKNGEELIIAIRLEN